jgi:hypothetical protein
LDRAHTRCLSRRPAERGAWQSHAVFGNDKRLRPRGFDRASSKRDQIDGVTLGADEFFYPLHGFLVALKLVAEMVADLPGTHPGCLVASFCYQDQLFNREIRELTREGVEGWRKLFLERIEAVARRYPPKITVDLTELADMPNTLVDGGIIMSKVLKDKTILPRQIMLYREFVRTIFSP